MEESFVSGADKDGDRAFESMRAEPRDSMFLMAVMRRPGGPDIAIKVRNLSSGGMMAEAPGTFQRGQEIEADLRGIGVVAGRIAWSAGGRIGVQFNAPVDPREARRPVVGNPQPQLVKPSRAMWRPSVR